MSKYDKLRKQLKLFRIIFYSSIFAAVFCFSLMGTYNSNNTAVTIFSTLAAIFLISVFTCYILIRAIKKRVNETRVMVDALDHNAEHNVIKVETVTKEPKS